MAINFLNLPEYKNPAPLDFKPLGDAIDSVGQNRLMSRKLDIADKGQQLDRDRFGLEKQRFGLEQGKFDHAKGLAEVERFGSRALAVDQLPDGPERQAAYAKLLAEHPQGANLPAAYRDPRMGPKLIAAEAGKMRDQLADDAKRAQLGLTQAQARESEAKARALGEKSETDSAIGQMIRGALPQAQPQAPAPGIQPQSFGGDPSAIRRDAVLDQPVPNRLMGDPNLIQTQVASPQQAQQGGPAVVETPLGPMPRDNARRLGFALGMAGKGDAGKMLMDATNVDAMGKEARNRVDKLELDTTERLARLNDITNTYQSKFLTLPEQVKQGVLSWKGYLGAKLPPEQDQSRREFVTFQQDTLNNLNRYIQEITGAAMGVQEAARITKSMPNMNDDPAAFEAKLANTKREAAVAIARQRYLRSKGFTGDAEAAAQTLPIERMQGIIRGRGQEVLKQIRAENPRIPDAEANAQAKQVIKAEFGLEI